MTSGQIELEQRNRLLQHKIICDVAQLNAAILRAIGQIEGVKDRLSAIDQVGFATEAAVGGRPRRPDQDVVKPVTVDIPSRGHRYATSGVRFYACKPCAKGVWRLRAIPRSVSRWQCCPDRGVGEGRGIAECHLIGAAVAEIHNAAREDPEKAPI